MREPMTRLTLFIPGAPPSMKEWASALEREGLALDGAALQLAGVDSPVQAEWVPNPRDGSFAQAFSFGTVTAAAQSTIDASPGALVLLFPIDLRDERPQIVSVVERLRNAGAAAVRIEQSKVGYDIERWLQLARSDDAWALHRLAVAMLGDANGTQSCGMHAFSLPDARVGPGERQELASILNVYQLAEAPLLLSGQTFSPSRDEPHRVVERWPDTHYPSNHPCHNPYGVWRIGPPGGTGRPQPRLAPVFMPSLAALLTALEKKTGRPLTQEQVNAATEQATCIAMEHRDAQKLERSRGYADLDPELAWEQWCAMRGG